MLADQSQDKNLALQYFFLKHRNETRGVGGIFYDYQDGSGLLYKGQNANGKASKIAKELGEYSLNWENLSTYV